MAAGFRLSVCRLEGNVQSRHLSDLRGNGGAWVRIGDQLLIIAKEDDSAAVARHMVKISDTFEWQAERVPRKNLWLVVQKGRLFRDIHPNSSVLLDNGRHLIVYLRRNEREAVKTSPEPCFGLFEIPWYHEIAVLQPRLKYRSTRLGWLQKIVNSQTQADIETHISHLVGFPTRYSTSAQYLAAADWCKGVLGEYGYLTHTEDIQVLGGLSRNVIAERQAPGSQPRPMTLIVAHLDSVNSAGGPTAPAPGADDNASGCAALLVLARELGLWNLKQDVRFLLFGGEEQGLIGSDHYVTTLSAGDRSRITAVINMDMIANLNALPPSVLLEGYAGSQGVMIALATAAATYTSLSVTMSQMPFGSDHVPFINAGLPAVLTIEGSDSSNAFIHTEGDNLNELDLNLALEILRMNIAYLAQSVKDAAVPNKNWLEPVLQVMMN